MKKYQFQLRYLCLSVVIIFQGCYQKEYNISPTITSASCPNVKLSVTLIRGTTYMGTMDVPYTGEKSIKNTIASIGVKGLSATLKTDNSISSNGYLHYTISGSPDTTGNAQFLINLSHEVCKVVVPIIECGY